MRFYPAQGSKASVKNKQKTTNKCICFRESFGEARSLPVSTVKKNTGSMNVKADVIKYAKLTHHHRKG